MGLSGRHGSVPCVISFSNSYRYFSKCCFAFLECRQVLREKGVQKVHSSIKVIPSLGRVLQNFVLRPHHLDLALRAAQRAKGAGQRWGGCSNEMCSARGDLVLGRHRQDTRPGSCGHICRAMALHQWQLVWDAAFREFCWAGETGGG